MTRARLLRRTCSLLLYVTWQEWICGRESGAHPTEIAVLLVKVLAGADLGGVA
jgi:hypothetical protein